MSKNIMYCVRSEQGARDSNEDRLIACHIGNDKYLFVCADGVGSENGGELAASIAASSVNSYLHDVAEADSSDLRMAVVEANNKIIELRRNPHLAHMGCALTACLMDITNEIMHVCHVGDTRLYTLQSNLGPLVQQTRDDSFVGQLLAQGLISEREAIAHSDRNRINKYLGARPLNYFSEYLYTTSISINRIQHVLLCTDGLYDKVNTAEIRKALYSSDYPDITSKTLVEMALQNRSHDNISVICIRIQ